MKKMKKRTKFKFKNSNEILRIKQEIEAALRKELNKHIGKQISELPEWVKDEIKTHFREVFSNEEMKNATVLTWNEFLRKAQIWVHRDPNSWWSLLKASDAVEKSTISKKIYVFKINVLYKIAYKISDNLRYAIVNYGQPALIIDADYPLFGEGYAVLKISSSFPFIWKKKAKLMGNIMPYINAMQTAIALDRMISK